MTPTQQSALLTLLGWRQIYDATANWVSMEELLSSIGTTDRNLRRMLKRFAEVFPLEPRLKLVNSRHVKQVRRIPDAG